MKHFRGGLFLIAIFFVATAIAQNSATTVSVDVSANRHPINPNVYGINWGEAPDAALNVTISRHGGNANSRYNWQLDAHSSGSDWYFETYSDGNTTPGASVDDSIRTSRAALTGAELMITIPMVDYLANLGPGRSTLPGFPVKKYGAQQKADPYNTDAGNGVSLATGKNITNDPSDNGVAKRTSLPCCIKRAASSLNLRTSGNNQQFGQQDLAHQRSTSFRISIPRVAGGRRKGEDTVWRRECCAALVAVLYQHGCLRPSYYRSNVHRGILG
jgi:hypothetical protein